MASPVNTILGLFGFELNPKSQENEIKDTEKAPSFVAPQSDDGAITINTGTHFGSYLDFNDNSRNEIELITKYREMSMQPELEEAINQIVNEAIVTVDDSKSITLNLDDLKQPASIKKKIESEFDNVLNMLDFRNMGQDWFRRWYVDGRLNFHVVIETDKPKNGIKELRYIDPRRIRKIREVNKEKDPRTGIEIIKEIKEYYIYNEFGQITPTGGSTSISTGIKIAADSIVTATSGLMDPKRVMVLSYLNKAIKPLNQLRMIEDSVVIYRMVSAPERRIFYIDVGNLPTVKADQYVKSVAEKYRNKLTYDATTGEIRDDRKFMSAIEDIWLPRKEGSLGTSVDRLEGGQNLGNIEDVVYFEKKLYKSLGVPLSRLDSQDSFAAGFGRPTEVTREEVNFNKFIQRLRNKFTKIFDEALKIQLILKGICTEEEWEEFKEAVRYNFQKDNNFEELKQSEILMGRIQLLTMVDPFVGKYFSTEYVQKKILQMTDEEIDEMQDQIDSDRVSNDLMGSGADDPGSNQAMFGQDRGAQQPSGPGGGQQPSPFGQ